jgi:hypothetical protein
MGGRARRHQRYPTAGSLHRQRAIRGKHANSHAYANCNCDADDNPCAYCNCNTDTHAYSDGHLYAPTKSDAQNSSNSAGPPDTTPAPLKSAEDKRIF